MNALELAEALKSMESGWFDDLTLKEAATMLRQQQAEIEALKKFKAEVDSENAKLFEAVQRANEIWDRATGRNQ
jgi:hypothetical protein